MVAIQGKLEEAGLPDVLQLLALGKKTGLLSLSDQSVEGHIYLDDGRIAYAEVANRRDRLGDMLVRGGRITQEQLAEAIQRQTADQGKHLGLILVESGTIERAELERFAYVQIEEAVYFLFTWRKGTFTFESGVVPPRQDFLVSINPEGLLLEGARRVDEWSLIQKKIPSFDMIFRVDKTRLAGSDVTLTPEQRRLLPLLDGAHDVNAVVEESAMAEFDVGKALYGLVSAGFAQLVDRRSTIRHLDYRELLAYLVHEAEFADPERRKEATRHIVDCQLCAPRLKEIHVRRTRETGAAAAAAVAAADAAPGRPKSAGAAAAPAPAPPAPSLAPKRRSGERAGPRDASGAPDRRRVQRRQVDRRQAMGAALPAGLAERRQVERRHVHRRLKDRLGAALSRTAAPAPSTARPKRDTVPRRLKTDAVEQASGAPAREPASPPAPAGRPVAPPAAPPKVAATLAEQTAAAAPSAPKPAAPARPPAPAPAAKPAAAGAKRAPGDRSKSKEIQWLISPEESSFHPVVKPQAPRPAQAAPARKPQETVSRPAASARAVAPSAAQTPAAQAPARPPVPATSAPTVIPAAQPSVTPAVAPAPAPAPRPWLPIAAMVVALASLGVAVTLMLQPRVSNGTDSRAALSGAAATAAAGGPVAAAKTEPAVAPEAAPPVTRSPEPTPSVAAPTTTRAPSRPAAAPPAQIGAEPAARRPVEVQRPAAAAPARAQAETPVVAPAPPPQPVPEPAAQLPAATPELAAAAGGIRGVVRNVKTGAAIRGARVVALGTDLSTTTDANGNYTLPELPPGPAVIVAAATGYAVQSGEVVFEPGAALEVNLAMLPPPAALKPDDEITEARWETIDRDEAERLLGQPMAVIPGLWVESIAKSAGSRPRVRVAQLTESGERVALVETRSGGGARGERPRLTALRLMPPSEAYPVTTGTGSFGSLLVTATSTLSPDELRALLTRLIQAPE